MANADNLARRLPGDTDLWFLTSDNYLNEFPFPVSNQNVLHLPLLSVDQRMGNGPPSRLKGVLSRLPDSRSSTSSKIEVVSSTGQPPQVVIPTNSISSYWANWPSFSLMARKHAVDGQFRERLIHRTIPTLIDLHLFRDHNSNLCLNLLSTTNYYSISPSKISSS